MEPVGEERSARTVPRGRGWSGRVSPGRPVGAVLVVLALLVSACAGGDDDSSTDTGDTEPSTTAPSSPDSTVPPTSDTAAVANAVRIEDSVEARVGASADFATVSDPVAVAAGDSVRTDANGYAEIAYFDGSVTRLDTDTDVMVVELVDDPGDSIIRIGMGVGRTWHRVQQLSGNDTYEVETLVATAAAQGTAFSISCPSETTCTFAVIEGSIELVLSAGATDTVDAPASVTVTGSEISDPQLLPFDAAFGVWLFDNATRDQDNGFDGPGQIYAQYGTAFASLEGTYDATGTTTRFDCDGTLCEDFSEAAHQTLERTYVFVVECETGACGGRATTEYQYNEEFINENVPLQFDGSAYEWELDARGDLCFTPAGMFGELRARFEWRLIPTAAEVRDNRYVATLADVEVVVDGAAIEPIPPECVVYLITYSLEQSLAAVRQPGSG